MQLFILLQLLHVLKNFALDNGDILPAKLYVSAKLLFLGGKREKQTFKREMGIWTFISFVLCIQLFKSRIPLAVF